MQTLPGGEARCGIGARLRSARERTGLTPLQAAERLHLDADVIEALEAETFESLGPSVYVRGHLKRYAELVGEQPMELQQNYIARAPAAPLPDLTRIPRQAPRDHRRELAGVGTLLVLAILLVGAVWWVARALRDTAVPIATYVIGPTAPGAERAVTRTEPPRPRTREPAQATSSRAPLRSQVSEPTAVVEPVRVAAAPSTLVLRFTEDSWVEVYDAQGARLFYDVGAANTAQTLKGLAPVRVVLGNAAGVKLEFDGRAATLPASLVREDGQARFVINRSGRIVRSRYPAGGVTQ